MRKLSIGFSSCPNDTYIFDALIHQRIEHEYEFKVYIEDVETLNQMALNHQLDVTKISIHACFYVLDQYKLLSSGGALGRGCGPLVVSKNKKRLNSGKIALPGKLTTASLLFQMAMPGDFVFVQMQFDEIIPAVTSGEVDAGVIIHESRFTYQESGLCCLMDLGQWWEDQTQCLIPLGGIVISNNVGKKDQIAIQRLIKESIQFAEKKPDAARGFILENAQEMEDQVIKSHINLYVNDFSKDLKEEGRRAVQLLYDQSRKLNLLPGSCLGKTDQLFIN